MRIALVTPSYSVDYDLCRILLDSVNRYVPADVQHFVIVSEDDRALFRDCADARTHVVVQEDLVAERFWRVPYFPRWRVNLRTLPVRGWIWQQMVKLSISTLDADAYMIVDSDTFFAAPFDPRSLVRADGAVPFFREEKDWYATDDATQKWARVSRRLLRRPRPRAPFRVGYVNSWGFWRRDVLMKLHAHISRGRGSSTWLRKIARNVSFSEYFLYGIFAEEILGLAAAGHYQMGASLCHDYWPHGRMTAGQVDDFAKARGDKVMVMINGKSTTAPADIRAAFGFSAGA